jgi:hypothetical protein
MKANKMKTGYVGFDKSKFVIFEWHESSNRSLLLIKNGIDDAVMWMM